MSISGRSALSLFVLLLNVLKLNCQSVPPACRTGAIVCGNQTRQENCNISDYHQFLSFTINRLMQSMDRRLPKGELKKLWKNRQGFCYIEAIVDKNGKVLFISYNKHRTLLTGSAGTPGWTKFQSEMKSFESKPGGMQMLLDLNGLQICHQLPQKAASRHSGNVQSSFRKKVLARFAQRSAMLHITEARVTGSGFKFINFDTDEAALRDMQPSVRTLSGMEDIVQLMHTTRDKHPLTLWIYKCPARFGVNDLPCNSEVIAYLFLRGWLNSSFMHHQAEDFFSESDWRQMFLTQDPLIIILMAVIPLYIAIQLNCLVWLGLSTSSTAD